MLQNSPKVVYDNPNVPSSDRGKRNKLYEDVLGIKERAVPNMQQVIHTDLERMKTNKVYDRKLNRDLNGPKGLNWQCEQQMQRLRSDERGIRRDLVRLNRDLAKVRALPPISRSPSMSHGPNSRLSSILEENNASTPVHEKPKSTAGSTVSLYSSRTSVTRLAPIKRKSSLPRRNSLTEELRFSSKPIIRQIIAKTSDDRPYLQQHADVIEYQQRMIDQKLKQFLH